MKRLWTALITLMLALSLTGVLAMAAPAMDLNGDGVVDEADQAWLLRYLVGKADLPEGMTEEDVDLNGNGRVDIFEAVLVQQYIEGIIDEFPGKDDPDEPVEGGYKIPAGLSAVAEGRVYCYGTSNYGYTDYLVEGKDGRAYVASLESGVGMQGIDVAFTDCYALEYRVYEGVLEEDGNGGASFVAEKVYQMLVLDGGTAADREHVKAFLRATRFDYTYGSPQLQEAVDLLLSGNLCSEQSLGSDDYIYHYLFSFDEEERVSGVKIYESRDGKEDFRVEYRFRYENGYTVYVGQYNRHGELDAHEDYVTDENGNVLETYFTYDQEEPGAYIDASAMLADAAGNILREEAYMDGELVYAYRYTYLYDENGRLTEKRSYLQYAGEEEYLTDCLSGDASYNAVYAEYGESGELRRECFLYEDFRVTEKRYDWDGLLAQEETWGPDGYLETAYYYDGGVLMMSVRTETEFTQDRTLIRRTFRSYPDGKEYLYEEDTFYADGSYFGQRFDEYGELVGESYMDGEYVWWQKSYSDGQLVMESGGDKYLSYDRYYQDGKIWFGYETERVYDGDNVVERLEYEYDDNGVRCLTQRTVYDEQGRELFEYYYRWDGSPERTVRYAYTVLEDGTEMTDVYQRYEGQKEVLLRRYILCADGGTREEQYDEDGDLTYVADETDPDNVYYEEYFYQWDEKYGKYLVNLRKSGNDGESTDYYYYPDGTLQVETHIKADGSIVRTEYYHDGTVADEAVWNFDGSGYERLYYENGTLAMEVTYYPGGRTHTDVAYAPDGTLEYSVRYEYTFYPDGETVKTESCYYADSRHEEYLCSVIEYDEEGNILSEAFYNPDGSLDQKIRQEVTYDEYGNLATRKVYAQYGDGEEFLQEEERRRDGQIYYYKAWNQYGQPLFEEIYDEYWNRTHKRWSYYEETGALQEYYEENSDGSYYLIRYDERGNVLEEASRDAEGNETYCYMLYYDEGSLRQEEYSYSDGSRYIKGYYITGEVEWEQWCEADGSERTVRYYKNGQVAQEAEMDRNRNYLLTIDYAEDGSILGYNRYEYVYNEYGMVLEMRHYILDGMGEEFLHREERYDEEGHPLYEVVYGLNDRGEAYLEQERSRDENGITTTKTYSADGMLSAESAWDDFGNGYTKHYHANGVLWTESRYVNGEEVYYAEYDEEGNLIDYRHTEVVYDENMVLIEYREYALDEEGNEYLRAMYRLEGEEARYCYYDSQGNLIQEELRSRDRVQRWYYSQTENGTAYLSWYEEMRADGGHYQQWYYESGALMEETFRDAEGNGYQYFYYEDGTVQSFVQYENDRGIFREDYDENGDTVSSVRWEFFYMDGYQEMRGYQNAFAADEYLWTVIKEYDNGDYYSFEYDKDGDLVHESGSTAEGFSHTSYNYLYSENGEKYLWEFAQYNVDGSYTIRQYRADGTLEWTSFRDGEQNGSDAHYYGNGEIMQETFYEYGMAARTVYYAEDGSVIRIEEHN